jgi:MoxR-like ATPase
VLPEDVKAVALNVLRHRLVLSYEAAADNVSSDEIISRILDFIPVP